MPRGRINAFLPSHRGAGTYLLRTAARSFFLTPSLTQSLQHASPRQSLGAQVFQVLTELIIGRGDCPGACAFLFYSLQPKDGSRCPPKKAHGSTPQWVTTEGFHFWVQNKIPTHDPQIQPQ